MTTFLHHKRACLAVFTIQLPVRFALLILSQRSDPFSSKSESLLTAIRQRLCTIPAVAPPTKADILIPFSESITIHHAWSRSRLKFNFK